MTSKRFIGFLVFVGVLAGNCAASAQVDCEALLGQFNAAIEKRSLNDAKALESTIATDAGCGMRLLDVQRRRSSFELLLAHEKINGGAPALEYEALIIDADKPDVLWRAAVALADMRFSQRRFGDATLGYERAIETIKNLAKTPVSPGEDTIKAALQRAAQSRALAANEESGSKAVFVTAAKDHRDGKIGGSMSQSIRGFKPTVVPIPVGFETATAKFTPVGEQAARELLDVVREQSPNEVVLVGHTDERGEAEYNMRLSAQRVAAVAAFLKQNGIAAKITTSAMGKSDPLQLANVSDLTREDIWALNRRVVWKRTQ